MLPLALADDSDAIIAAVANASALAKAYTQEKCGKRMCLVSIGIASADQPPLHGSHFVQGWDALSVAAASHIARLSFPSLHLCRPWATVFKMQAGREWQSTCHQVSCSEKCDPPG